MSEEAFQINAASFLRRAVPLNLPWTAIEPAGRGARDGARQKRKGVNPGWMDFQFTLPPFGTYLGLECKAKDGSPSASQKENGAKLVGVGAYWFPVKTLGDVEYVLRQFGLPLQSRSMERPRPHLVKLVEAANIGWIADLVRQSFLPESIESARKKTEQTERVSKSAQPVPDISTKAKGGQHA